MCGFKYSATCYCVQSLFYPICNINFCANTNTYCRLRKNLLSGECPTPVPLLLTYLLTAWSRVLLEKLTGFAANQEIPRIL